MSWRSANRRCSIGQDESDNTFKFLLFLPTFLLFCQIPLIAYSPSQISLLTTYRHMSHNCSETLLTGQLISQKSSLRCVTSPSTNRWNCRSRMHQEKLKRCIWKINGQEDKRNVKFVEHRKYLPVRREELQFQKFIATKHFDHEHALEDHSWTERNGNKKAPEFLPSIMISAATNNSFTSPVDERIPASPCTDPSIPATISNNAS